MNYALITSVGKGMYKDDGHEKGYRTTTYSFPNGKTYTTKLFLEAVFAAQYREISKVILIGTETSSWGALIDEKLDENLWFELIDEKKVENDSELAKRISVHVESRFGVKTSVIIHTDTIDSDTSQDLFRIYKNIGPEILEGEDILFDITHGFRSMPVLIYQALQFSVQKKNVELIYGEFNDEAKLSYVRNLSEYWKYAQISNAMALFSSKIDGFLLADLLEPDWQACAKVIRKISNIVQTNFSLQIVDVLRNIKNVLLKNEYQNEKPWFTDVRNILSEFSLLLDEGSMAKTLFNYAKYLKSKNLNTQATIALQVCVETAIAEKCASKDKIGDYDWWSDYGKDEWKNIINKHKGIKDDMYRLVEFRNQIAHGGGKGKNTGAFPQAENTENIFVKCEKTVEKFLDIVEKI